MWFLREMLGWSVKWDDIDKDSWVVLGDFGMS